MFALGQFVGAQFPKRIDDYTEDLNTKRKNFVEAMTMQIARDVDVIGMWITLSDVFLRLNIGLQASDAKKIVGDVDMRGMQSHGF